MNLATPIEKIPRIGPAYQKRLKKLGIKTIGDLLYHFPHRYEDFSNLVPISEAKIGENISIKGKIIEIENIRTWKKRMILTQALVTDDSGTIKVIWFNQPYLINVLEKGDFVCLAGKMALRKPKKGGYPEIYLGSPAYEKIPPPTTFREEGTSQISILKSGGGLTHTGRIVPIYPETEGLSSRWLRFIIKPLLTKLKKELSDPLPEKIRIKHQLLPFQEAIWQIHFPDSLELAKKAQKRFSFEELFNLSLLVLKERQKVQREKAVTIPLNLELIKDFTKSLPFKLTDSQKKSAWQILKDLEKFQPMNRLLEGDVGSGKTVVATMAILNTAKAGYQAVFMAPTEILAKQHFKTVTQLLENFNLKIGLLTGKENKIYSKNEVIKISRKNFLEKIVKGEINILIGTQALIQEKVKFGRLALVVLDEQHRFGVEQRAKLVQQSAISNQQSAIKIPHFLSMTATPIPRTLALSIYGDLDLSIIDQLPKGRKEIITKIVSPINRKRAYDFIRSQVRKGKQVFVICPRIEPAENQKITSWAEVKAVKEEYNKLSKIIFPDLKVETLHGQMATKEKEEIMKKFKERKIDILVSTSVIEVGIDIPNATLMMIEGAERFGLAQLHQFRGRVGRGKFQSFCFLFTESPAKKTKERLKALLKSKNSFELAEKDLEIRGPGDFFGKRQWGIPDLAMSSLKDIFMVKRAREAAKKVLEEDSELKKYPLLRERIEEFGQRIHLE